jgi:hypothetical protein
MPGFLYQTIGTGEKEQDRRDRQRESVRDRPLLEERDSVSNKMTVVENMWHECARLISELIKRLLMILLPRLASYLC